MMGIVKLADLFSITTETFRKYEAKKILQPYRDDNGYRKYHSWELTKIIRARQLRGEGLSLNDIAAEIEQGDPARQLRDMAILQQQLVEKIAYQEKLIRWLQSRQEDILSAEALGERCAIERQSRRHCCIYMVEDTLVDKKGHEWNHLKEWIQALPFARVCYVGGSVEHMFSCLSLKEEELELYGLQHLTPDFVIPEQSCVVCNGVAEHMKTRDTSAECIASARKKAEEMGVKLACGAMLEMIRYTHQGELFRSHNKAIFPIEAQK